MPRLLRVCAAAAAFGFAALSVPPERAEIAVAAATNAEQALLSADIDGARRILAPHLANDARLSRPVRVRLRRIAGDVESFATRSSEAEDHYLRAVREGGQDPVRRAERPEPHDPVALADEIVRARVGLAVQAQLLTENKAAEAHLRLAERHLGACSDDARATYLEGLASVMTAGSCAYPCPISLEGLGTPMRQAIGIADEAVALRRRILPESEGWALRLRAFARFRTPDASREDVLRGHEDLLESIRLLTRSGSRYRLVDALRTFTTAMDNPSGLRGSDTAAIEAATSLLPEGSSWTRFRLAFEIAQRKFWGRDPGHRQWSCVALETAEEMSRYVRTSRESRAGWANMHTRAYFAGANVAFETQGAEPALRTVERIRGRLLSTVIAGRRNASKEPGESRLALVAEHRRLSRRTVAKDGTLDPDVVARLWELGALLDAPHLEGAPAAVPTRLTDDVPPGALLLYYPFTTERLFVLERGKDVRVVKRELEYHELWPLVARLRTLLADPGSDAATLTEIASTLYDALLGAVDADIVRAHRLIIVTDGNLEQIPFAALLRVRGQDARFLGTWKPLSNVLSVSVRRELARRPPAPANGGIAIFADPRNPAFEELPDAAREGARIARVWGDAARLFVGARATRGAVFEEFGRARILHVATHAVSNAAFALATGLVTAPEGPEDDGVLRAWELIHQTPLRADLVVLSGCETGPGTEWSAAGEGSFDLSRHFLEAGAGAVLSASWRISDEATAEFMITFHRELRKGSSPDAALRRAQAILAGTPRWAHPFNWAAFRLVGLGEWPTIPH